METPFRMQKGKNATKTQKQLSRTRNRGGQSNGSRRKRTFQPEAGKVTTFRPELNEQFVTRAFGTQTNVSSNGSGLIAVGSFLSSDVTSNSDWGNFSQEYNEYRVREMEIDFFPATTNATSTTGPYQGVTYAAGFYQAALPTLSAINQQKDRVAFSTLERKTVKVSASGLNNAQLWTPVGTGVAADRDFGISYAGASTLAVSSVIHSVHPRWMVEFRGAK